MKNPAAVSPGPTGSIISGREPYGEVIHFQSLYRSVVGRNRIRDRAPGLATIVGGVPTHRWQRLRSRALTPADTRPAAKTASRWSDIGVLPSDTETLGGP